MDNNFTKGQQVTVTDFRGKQHQRRVWEDRGCTVLITSDEVYQALLDESTELYPIGIPKSDVAPIEIAKR